MRELQRPARAPDRTALVTLSAEIDIANADGIGEQIAAAAASGVSVVVADMTATTFCDCSAIGMLLLACQKAAAHGVEVRLAPSCPGVLRVMELLGADRALPVGSGLDQALAGGDRCGPAGRAVRWRGLTITKTLGHSPIRAAPPPQAS